MHGGRNQNQRNRSLQAFSSGRTQALIATDVVARGIHVDAVMSVIHFDPPADHKDYLHRSGRTARAGATGTIVSLVTGDQKRAVRRMQQDLDLLAPIEEPRLATLHNGGYRISARAITKSKQRGSSTRTAARPKKASHPIAGDEQSVYVANLPWGVTEEDIHTLFGHHGDVHQTTIITDRKTGRSRGFGFVNMSSAAARAAIDALHGSKLEGRDLIVRPARPRR